MARLSINGRAALAYAARGLAVFRMHGKVPLKGSHGELDATTDPAVVESWWLAEPDASIAVSLRFTDYFGLDTDRRHFGDETIRALECEYGSLPHTPTVVSGSGGFSTHQYFRRTAELEGVTCRALRIPGLWTSGVDLKGVKYGYLVLPPSKHPKTGRAYTWEAQSRIDEVPIADPPPWLVALIRRSGSRTFDGAEHTSSVSPESFYLGFLFKRANMLGREVRPGVFAAQCPNEHRHSPGKSSDSSAVIFAPAKPGGRGRFFCSHTSACSEVFR